ncbi:WD repeat protein-like protein [Amniculicola lignicola CBS 123094]|uniref:WD repeat protein-like protein n=1 Tax=Amniculicola lignicola CBS 123094 TaxID=1392246 RepID=A0A6A5W7W3_9PLEO|nr:WD repeat protein-like protein [Amniculicola lignicola CBS 123094]
MGRNARKRISYVLPLANGAGAGGHRLGVNGLAVDPANSILYSGGRDGVICAWDLNLDLRRQNSDDRDPFADTSAPSYKPPPTQFRQQVQAHTHWINDIALAQGNEALVSASSDITVKVWRPAAQDVLPPQTIGLHTDYVKRVASPGPRENWVASGGLDHKINLWDLNGGGQKLQIAVGEDENTAKGSVYALAATSAIIASGGPESTVRIWDARTGKRITKFVGHTDNVRDVLITQDGDTILTASSDQTVKVWSMTAGRCMYTLTMHNDSVWSLHSDDPQLSVFYSSDRSGLVAKSDVRNCAEMDEGVSVAVCQEHEGVNKVIQAGDHIWTATSSSSINRWNDVETAAEVALPESYKWHRSSVATTRSRYPSPPSGSSPLNGAVPKIPFKALLRMSNTAPFPLFSSKDNETSTVHSVNMARKPSESMSVADQGQTVPCRQLPDFSIEGQNGLIKHHLLNDRRRVLTLDTAGEVILWDLLQCVAIKSFGKRHLEDVVPEVNTRETVAHWCAVDTRTGSLTCVLEENYCFDAEMYADELELDKDMDFREDQRINLGKWILRYLFCNLIDEEIKRDEDFRNTLIQEKSHITGRPTNIQIPESNLNGWNASGPASGSTIRPSNGFHFPPTPGMAIGLATPGLPPSSAGHSTQQLNPLTPTTEEGSQLEKSITQQSQQPKDTVDYFSSAPPPTNGNVKSATETSADSTQENLPQSPSEEAPTNQKKGKALFSKKFNMSFNMKKLGITSSTPDTSAKPAAVDEKSEDSDSRSTKTDEKVMEDNLFGFVQKMRQGYEEQANLGAGAIQSQIAPSLPNETPVLKPPPSTTILIQEDRPDSGGVADLFEGTVGTLGQQTDLIEKCAPVWLADVLLRNQIPLKDIVKVSFILEPYQNVLPSISADGNNRLNANRMLRARKILSYVAERIEPAPEKVDEDALKPEEYLELYCQNQLISPTMTLASIRAHVWRGGGDVLLLYKANGRKEIKHAPAPGTPPQAGSTTISEGKASSDASRSSQQSSRGIVEGKAC